MSATPLPPECQGFAQSPSTQLLGLLGSFAWRGSAAIEVLLASDDGAIWTLDRDRRATAWDPATGTPIRSIALDSTADEGGAPASGSLSRDGARLLVGRSDGRMALFDLAAGARLWEVSTQSMGRPSARPRGEKEGPAALHVALSPDGTIAVSALENDPIVRVWIGKTPLGEIAGRGPATFSPDGSLLCLHDVIADVRVGRALFALPREPGRERRAAAFSPDTSAILTGDEWGTVELFHLARREILWAVRVPELAPGRPAAVQRAAFSADGRSVVTVTSAGVQFWDVAAGRIAQEARFPGVSRVAMAPTRGRAYALSGGNRTAIRPFDLQRGVELDDAGHLETITSIATSPRAPTAITGSSDGTLRLWHLASRTVLRTLDGLGAVAQVAFFPDGRRVAGAGQWRIRIWDVATGAVAIEIEKAPGDEVTALAVSPEGARVAIAVGGEVLVWDVDRKVLIFAVKASAKHLAFSSEGARVFVVTTTSKVSTLDARTGDMLGDSPVADDQRPQPHAFLAGGRTLAVLPGDGLAIRDLDGGAVRARFPGSRSEERLLAVSPDERIAVTTGEARRLTLWDVIRMQRLDTLDLASSSDRPVSAAFTPDGRSLLIGTARGVLLHFDLRGDAAPIVTQVAQVAPAPAQVHVPHAAPSAPATPAAPFIASPATMRIPEPSEAAPSEDVNSDGEPTLIHMPSAALPQTRGPEDPPRSDPRARTGLPTTFRQLIPGLRQRTRDNEQNLAFHLSRLERVPVASLYHPADTLAIRAAGLGVPEVSGWFVRFEPYVLAGIQFLGQFPAADRTVHAVAMLKFVNTALSCGARLPPIVTTWEPAWLESLAARSEEIEERDRTTLAFAALSLGAARFVPVFTGYEPLPSMVVPGQTFGFGVTNFVRYLAAAMAQGLSAADVEPAWIDFVRHFVRKMVVESLDGTELMYAARAYFVHFERRPVSSVAQALHELVTS